MNSTEPTTDQTLDQAAEQAPPPPPYAAPAPAPIRRLTRPRDDRMISGVSAGIARYMNVDATLIRLLVVVLGIFTFPFGVLGYLVAWAVMPQD